MINFKRWMLDQYENLSAVFKIVQLLLLMLYFFK